MAEEQKHKGDMTTRDAGKKGGERTAETHGHEFYEEILNTFDIIPVEFMHT